MEQQTSHPHTVWELADMIIGHLLLEDELDTGQIADRCGFKEKGENKYNYVNKPLMRLTDICGFLESRIYRRKGDDKRRSTYYHITDNFALLESLYTSKYLKYDRMKFRRAKKILNLIINNQFFEFDTSSFQNELEGMLKTSESFFQYALTGNISYKDLSNLVQYERQPYPVDLDLYKEYIYNVYGGTHTKLPPKYSYILLYSLYSRCLFKDYLKEYLKRKFPDEIQDDFKKIESRFRVESHKIRQYSERVIIMNILETLNQLEERHNT
jgi:hypothetical protein